MTPDHKTTIQSALEAAYTRTVELNNALNIPTGKNPPTYTYDLLWASPLAHDLTAIAEYTEGHQAPEDISLILSRAARTLFGDALNKAGYRLPHRFHKTQLGKMMYEAFARYFPSNAWMTTAEVQRLLNVKRQTIYDWAEEGRLTAYFVDGKQVYLRQQIEKFHTSRRSKGIATQL